MDRHIKRLIEIESHKQNKSLTEQYSYLNQQLRILISYFIYNKLDRTLLSKLQERIYFEYDSQPKNKTLAYVQSEKLIQKLTFSNT